MQETKRKRAWGDVQQKCDGMHAPGNGILITVKQLSVCIGGLTLGLKSARSHLEVGLTTPYQDFKTDNPPDVFFHVYDKLPNLRKTVSLFKTNGAWKIIQAAGDKYLRIANIAVSYGDQSAAKKIYITTSRDEGGRKTVYPLVTPIDQILMSTLMSRRNGILTHACGADVAGKGILFVGSSGAGKTTIARLLQDSNSAHILSDDRVAIYQKDGCLNISGTPWPGDLGAISSKSVPLHSICFLKKAGRNRITSLSRAQTVAELVVKSFLPIWDLEASKYALQTCVEIARQTAGRVFEFTPDKKAVDFILKSPL